MKLSLKYELMEVKSNQMSLLLDFEDPTNISTSQVKILFKFLQDWDQLLIEISDVTKLFNLGAINLLTINATVTSKIPP